MIPKHNPWWRDPSEIFNDEKIKEFEAATIQWRPRIKYYIKFDKDKIYTLRGPRQVGKTTLIKLLIKNLLTEGKDSKSIFYYSCDLVASEKELFEVINEYLDWARTFRLDRKYIFLDEISSVKNWEKGGVPRAINDFFSKNSIDNSIYELYIRSLIGDLARWQVQETYVKQILRSIDSKLTTNVSWQSIVKDTDIGSHNTVSKCTESLVDSFVLNILYSVDIGKKNARFKKEKKIYFQDPFIFHSLRSWVTGLTDYFNGAQSYLDNPEDKSKLVESVVESHLIRLMYNTFPSDVFNPHEHIFYWKKSGGGKEVDFVLKSKENDLLPIELKFQNEIQKSDYKGLRTFPGRKGILLSKKKFDMAGNYATIPASLFLLLI